MITATPVNVARNAFRISSPLVRFSFLLLGLLLLGTQTQTARAATINVAAGGDFQAALNSAQPGDTIVLAAGAVYNGPYLLPNKSGSAYITVQSSALGQLPPAGTRVSPLNAAFMPKIISPDHQTALYTAAGAHHFRFVGIEFTVNSANAQVYNLIDLGSDQQTQQSQIPHHLTFERCYVHAHANQSATGWVRNGFALNANHVEILESYISDFRLLDNEGHAIVGWNSPGPFKINNNFIEASGVNVLFGGAWAFPGMNPTDLEFKRNHVNKRPAWRGVYSVKNLFELKDMRRAVIDGNLFEHNWASAQPGYAILFTPASLQSGPNARIEDIQFTNNIVRHSASGIDITGRDYGDPAYPNIPVQTNRITIKNNLFYDIGGQWGEGRFMLLTSGGGPDDLTVDHNTIIHTGSVILLDSGPQARLNFNNNIMAHNEYGIIGVGWMGGGIGSAALNAYAPGYTFRRNLVAGANQSQYPADNYYPSSLNAAGFVNGSAGNYRLSTASPYRNAGTDGKDLGCDFNALEAAMAGTVGGPGPGPTPTPTPVPTPSPTPTPAPSPAPPAGAFFDNFDDNLFDGARWIYDTIQGAIYTGPSAWDATVSVIERNQRLEVSPRSNVSGDHYNGYVFTNAWNMTNARASVEVIQAASGTSDTNLALCLNSQNFYMMSVEGGQLRFEQVVNGTRSTTTVAYNAAQHRHWRIRHDATSDSIVFETSADGSVWTARRSVARQLSITSLRAEISAGTWEPVQTPGMAVFDNFRLESNVLLAPLASPQLVANARQTALNLGSQPSASDASINALVGEIEQAYTAFVTEYNRFSASGNIDKNLRAALGSANMAIASPRHLVRKRLLIAAEYLGNALTLMQTTGARVAGEGTDNGSAASAAVRATPAAVVEVDSKGVRRRAAQLR